MPVIPETSRRQHGFTMIELLATVVVLSILAVMVAPMGAVIFFQDKELMLKENLREIRNSIDRFHDNNVKTFAFEADVDKQKQNYYPMSWQDLYEGYLRKSHALNPVTHKFEDFDVILDKKGIWYSEDFINWWQGHGAPYTSIDDMPYPTDTVGHIFEVGAEKDTVMLSPEQFAMRLPRADLPLRVELIANLVWWDEAGIFDVRFPSKNREKVKSLDETSYYHEW